MLEAVRGLAYVEKSPSGTGIHVILRGDCGKARKLALGPHAGIEVYQTGRYFTMTGDVLPGSVAILPPAQHALDAILTEFFPAPSTPARQDDLHASIYAHGRAMARRRCAANWTTSRAPLEVHATIKLNRSCIRARAIGGRR